MGRTRSIEQRLQDYVDGRMSGAEREAFEAELDRDPGLARRVVIARRIGQALREDSPELSSGFYARASARFGETNRAGGLRLLTWETLGLAAAAVLALVVFVPQLLRDGAPALPPPATSSASKEAVEPSFVDAGETLVDEQEPLVAIERNEAAPSEDADREPTVGAIASAPETKVAEEPKRAKKGPRARPMRDEPVGEIAAAPRTVPADAEEFRGAGADSPQAAFEQARVEYSRADVGKSRVGKDEVDSARKSTEMEAMSTAMTEYREAPTEPYVKTFTLVPPPQARAVPLPPGLAKPESVREVESLEWSALLAGPEGETLRMLGEPTSGRRLILIGPRPGLDCESLAVIDDGAGQYLLYVIPERKAGVDPGGCGLALPDDGRRVAVVGTLPP